MLETRFNKKNTIEKNLLLIKGLGLPKIKLICTVLGINSKIRIKDLSKTHTDKLYTLLSKIKKQSHTDFVETTQQIERDHRAAVLLLNKAEKHSLSLAKKKARSSEEREREYMDIKFFLINLHTAQGKTSNKLAQINLKRGFNNQQTSFNPIYSVYSGGIVPVKLLIDDNLEDYEKKNIHNLIVTNTYRGRRIKLGYPSRGQRTRTNARTAKKFRFAKIKKDLS